MFYHPKLGAYIIGNFFVHVAFALVLATRYNACIIQWNE